MTDEDQKRLMEYLGECWHEWEDEKVLLDAIWRRCKNCKKASPFQVTTSANVAYFEPWVKHRTFTIGNDMVALADRIVERGEWVDFFGYCESHCDGETLTAQEVDSVSLKNLEILVKKHYALFTAWLLNPPRFCALVAGWLKEKEGK